MPNALVAQLDEHGASTSNDAGSSPVEGAKCPHDVMWITWLSCKQQNPVQGRVWAPNGLLAQLVERVTVNHDVTGSSPVLSAKMIV